MPKGDKSFFEFLKGDDFKTKDSLTQGDKIFQNFEKIDFAKAKASGG